jgi:hypothetical protein
VTVENGAKRRIVTLFCAAGIVSAALTPEFLMFLPAPDPEVQIEALVNPAIPFALLMLVTGIVLAQRGLLTLPYPPGLGELVVGTCVIAFGYFVAKQTFGLVLWLAFLVPTFAFALPLALFAAGIAAAGFAGGPVRIFRRMCRAGALVDRDLSVGHRGWLYEPGTCSESLKVHRMFDGRAALVAALES